MNLDTVFSLALQLPDGPRAQQNTIPPFDDELHAWTNRGNARSVLIPSSAVLA
jgi:hypothetical protein